MISGEQESSGNFYVVGGALALEAPSYIERQADRQLLTTLLNHQFCYILDSRQVGKTSLMVKALRGLADHSVQVVSLDLTLIGKNLSAEQWYSGLLRALSKQLDLRKPVESYWFAQERLGPSQRWFGALEEVILPALKNPLVIFIDEIDAVRGLSFSTDELFAGIRAIYQQRTQNPEWEKITFCLVGAAAPAQLIQEVRSTPFNIGQGIAPTDFTLHEAEPLAMGLLPLVGSKDVAKRLLNRIHYWTNGHPYLTQRLCQQLLEGGVGTPKAVDDCCTSLFLNPRARTEEINFISVGNTFAANEMDRIAALNLYRRVLAGRTVEYQPADPAFEILRLSGLVTVREGRVVPRNRIYARIFGRNWIKEMMPGAELRRQRQALWRGIGQASMVWIIVLGALLYGYLQNRSAVQAVQNEQQARHKLDRVNHDLEAAQTRLGLATKEATRIERESHLSQTKARERLLKLDDIRRAAEAQARRATSQLRASQGQLQQNGRTLTKQQQELARVTSEATTARKLAKETAGLVTGQYGTLAGALGGTRGRQYEALEYSLKEIDLAKRSGRAVDAPMLQRLADAVNIGLMRRRTFTESFAIDQASFNRQGNLLVTGGKSHFASVWDVGTGKRVQMLDLYPERAGESWRSPDSLAFSADGNWLVTGVLPGTVRVWQVTSENSQNPLRLYTELKGIKGSGFPVMSVAISPHGGRVIVPTQDNSAEIWTLATGERQHLPGRHKAPVWAVAFAPDRPLVATGSEDGLIKLWNYKTNKQVAELSLRDPATITALSFSRDLLLVARKDGMTFTWGADSQGLWHDGERIKEFSWHRSWASTMMPSPDNAYRGHELAATASKDGTTALWNLHWPTSDPLFTLDTHKQWVTDARFSWDGRRLVTASWDRTAQVWDITQPLIFNVGGKMNYAEFSSSGHLLVTSGDDASAIVHNLESGITWPCFNGVSVRHTTITRDEKVMVTADTLGRIRLWRTGTSATGAREPLGEVGKHNGIAYDIRLTRDEKTLVSVGTDKAVRFWDVTARKQTKALVLPAAGYSVELSPDESRVLVSCADGVVRILSRESGSVLHSFPARDARDWPNEAAFSPDGRWVAVAESSGSISFWEASTGRLHARLIGHIASATSVAFAPDGQRLASAGQDGQVHFWDVSKLIQGNSAAVPELSIRAHTAGALSVRFSPNGESIVTAGADGTVRPFPATLGAYLKRAHELQKLPYERLWQTNLPLPTLEKD